ncbi:MAG: hypothetical protein IJ515_04535 [Clostridia bacterium]|nr:hypothetical protein [Clostridia bacterium]
MAEPDISRVISLILENPALVEQIKNLGAEESSASEVKESADTPSEEAVVAPAPAEAIPRRSRGRRTELIEALKPYISEERRKAIESFITIADILDMMRAK